MPDVVGCTLADHLARYRPRRFALVFTTAGATRCAGPPWVTYGTGQEEPGLLEWATFHHLRHLYASLLIAEDSSVKTVERHLGHQSAMEPSPPTAISGSTQ